MVSILIYLQANNNKIHDGSLELCAKARELAKKSNTKVYGVYVGQTCSLLESEFVKTGLDEIYTYPSLARLTLNQISTAIIHCIDFTNPEILLFTGTLEGRSIAPTVAAHCKTGVTADCTELDITKEGLLKQVRPAFGGNIMAEIHTPTARPQVATVRPGVFMADNGVLPKTKVTTIDIIMPVDRITLEEVDMEPISEGQDSNVVIAVGGGIQRKEELDLLAKFCDDKGILLMCSRSLVQRGWLPQTRQIGLSGRSISSKLLVTMGISGSVQFMSGIKHVDRIVAINTDQTAPIMMLADVPICADLNEVILNLEFPITP